MKNLDRRAFLQGSLIAAPVVAVVSLTPMIPARAAAEGGLPALLDRFLDVNNRACDATTAREECEIEARKTFPKRPRALMAKRDWFISGPKLVPVTASELNEWFDQSQRIFKYTGAAKAKHEKLRTSRLRLLAKWEAREQAILDRAGWQSLKATEMALDAETDRLRDVIAAYTPQTMADVAAKLRFFSVTQWSEVLSGPPDNRDLDYNESVFVSLLADVDRLAERGSAA